MTAIARFKRAHGLTYEQLAHLLGLRVGYAKKLGCGAVRRTSAKLARQIEARSRGEIRKEELVFPDEEPRRRAGAA